MNDVMAKQMTSKGGLIAALDQSGGSTPGALRHYGIPDTAIDSPETMFALMHDMRVRIMTAPPFDGGKVIAAILFEATMDGVAAGEPVPTYLWQNRGIVPFVKVDKGLAPEADGVSLMKPMPELDVLLERARALAVFGTKMRSVINLPSSAGIAKIVAQQFEFADRIAAHGLMPIIEPEVLITSPDKRAAEAILRAELERHLAMLQPGYQVMLKLTIPETPDLYAGFANHPGVMRVVALSGGYGRAEACRRLAATPGVIASFSRALIEDLKFSMSDAAFDLALSDAIEAIYAASTTKHLG